MTGKAPVVFWDEWQDMARVAGSAVLMYVAVIVILRVAGKRTLSQLNLFDWVVTVAVGSMVATTVLSPSVSLAAGVTGIGTLVALQFLVAFLEARNSKLDVLVKAEPRLLVHRGQLRYDAMREERITEREVMQALRQHGFASPAEVTALVLETNGSLSVIRGDAAEQDERALARLGEPGGEEA
jgi:uncharacterized membrane protein YcaP (DUF421 family)